MKWYILVGVILYLSPVGLFAIDNDLEARMDDFGIAESVPDDKSIVVEEDNQHAVSSVKSIDNSEDKQIADDITWKRVTIKGKYGGKSVSLKIPTHWILTKKSNEWEIKENDKMLIAFKVDKEFFNKKQFDKIPPLAKDFQKSMIEINGQKILDVSLWMEHKKIKYYSRMYTLMDFKLKNNRKKLIFMLTTTDKLQSKKILNFIVQSLEITQPDSKTKSKDSLIKHIGKVLELHKIEAGEADDVIKTITSYTGSMRKDTVYTMAKIDLNGDGVDEVIIHVNQPYGYCRDYEGTCMIALLERNKDQKWVYISMSTYKAKEISILPTATNGYYDLAVDNVLHTYTDKRFGYRIGKKQGVLAPTKEALHKTTLKTVENFGLSIQISTAWKSKSAQRRIKPFRDNWASYKGTLPSATKMLSLGFHLVIKSDNHYESEFSSNKKMVYRSSKIGSGIISGHAVNVYYYDGVYDGKQDTKRGGIYLLFEDKMYFAVKEDDNDTSRYVYIKLDGDLFLNLNEKDIQPILDDYVTPFLNTIKVTKNNTFTTDSTTEHTPLILSYGKDNIQSKNIVTKEAEQKLEKNITTHDSKKIENKYMKTELHEAARSGNLTKLKEALNAGVEVNVVDKLGRTPLHYAAFSGYVSIARILLEKGADINAVDKAKQWTPLFFAVYKHQKAMIKLLIERGADQTLKDKLNKTANDYKKDR